MPPLFLTWNSWTQNDPEPPAKPAKRSFSRHKHQCLMPGMSVVIVHREAKGNEPPRHKGTKENHLKKSSAELVVSVTGLSTVFTRSCLGRHFDPKVPAVKKAAV